MNEERTNGESIISRGVPIFVDFVVH